MTQLTTTPFTRHFTDVMDDNREDTNLGNGRFYRGLVSRVILADGGSMSIQASEFHYSEPRRNLESYADYECFEIGFPSKHYPELDQYQDYSFNGGPTNAVYVCVPKEVIEELISRAGGVSGVLAE